MMLGLKRVPFVMRFDVKFGQSAFGYMRVLYVCAFVPFLCRLAYYLKSPYASPLLPSFSTTSLSFSRLFGLSTRATLTL